MGKSPDKTQVILVPQPHGGALKRGGTSVPGPGRPPSELRRRMRGSLEENLAVAIEIVQRADAKDSDKIRALDFFAKYGLGPKEGWDKDQVVDLVKELGAVVAEYITDDAVLMEIKEKWLAVLRRANG